LMPFYARFMARFPTVEVLAAAPEADVLAAWAGLGYYSRARNLHRAAKAVVAAGGFPRTVEGLLELPGVGPYTAAAVASQSFGVAAVVWDGNVQRVMSRVAGRADVFSAGFKTEMLARLDDVLRASGAAPSEFNQGLMELGALVCMPRSPVCGRCPLSEGCVAFREGRVGELPPPKPRKAFVDVQARVFVAERDGRYLLVQRRPGQWFAGLWDFPSELGGVRSPVIGVDVPSSAKRNFRPASGGTLGSEVPLGGTSRATVAAKHTITHHKISLKPELVSPSDVKTMTAGAESRWFTLDEMLSADVALATTAKKVLRVLGVEGAHGLRGSR
jgi:A/G-specific adenine glycosylase